MEEAVPEQEQCGAGSLAAGHLTSERTIVIAHELMELFKFTDHCVYGIIRFRRGLRRQQLVVVGAQDAAGRADPLSIIDPTTSAFGMNTPARCSARLACCLPLRPDRRLTTDD